MLQEPPESEKLELACPICRAKPIVQMHGLGEGFDGAYAVEATVHTIQESEYRQRFQVLVVHCPHCYTVLGVVRAD